METTIWAFEYRVRVGRERIVKAFYKGEYRKTSRIFSIDETPSRLQSIYPGSTVGQSTWGSMLVWGSLPVSSG